MKSLRLSALCLLVSALCLSFTGCATGKPGGNSSFGPDLLHVGVNAAAVGVVIKYPDAIPPMRVAASVICAASNGTNIAPADIVRALDAAVTPNKNALLAITVGLNLYSVAYNGLVDKSAASASPYLKAVCDGISEALLLTPDGLNAPLARARSPKALEQISQPVGSAQWPQLRLP